MIKITSKIEFNDSDRLEVASKPFIEQIEMAVEAAIVLPITVIVPTINREIINYIQEMYTHAGWEVITAFDTKENEVKLIFK